MDESTELPVVPRRRRRWFSYSLRTLLLLTGLAAAVLGVWVNRAERQRRAVAAILEVGGQVAYDFEMDGSAKSPVAYPSSETRDWLRERLGPDFVSDVVIVQYPNATDAGLVRLRGLTKLEGLWLVSSRVGDPGLVHLRGLTKLKRLFLSGTSVSDAGLVHLGALTKLEVLDLDDTQISDAGLVRLRGLSKLKSLGLSGTQVSDAGLLHLCGLTKLEILDLRDTQVTDAGLAHLRGLTKLIGLGLHATQVTDAGSDKLQQALPNCRISR